MRWLGAEMLCSGRSGDGSENPKVDPRPKSLSTNRPTPLNQPLSVNSSIYTSIRIRNVSSSLPARHRAVTQYTYLGHMEALGDVFRYERLPNEEIFYGVLEILLHV